MLDFSKIHDNEHVLSNGMNMFFIYRRLAYYMKHILFIGAGIFACLVSVPSILYYIAAILCFTRKKGQPQEAPVGKEQRHISSNHEQIK